MEPTLTKILIVLIILPVIVLSGIFLRRASSPYNNMLFALHKTAAVASVIFSVIVIRIFIINPVAEGLLVYMLYFTAFLILAGFISGALQSFEKPPPVIVNIIHKVSSYLMLVCIPLTFLLLFSKET